jgi:two-component system, chemotaxis family, chemotaxis protein CheY
MTLIYLYRRSQILAKILVVDDSITMRQMVEFTLEKAGHEVKTAEDGLNALGACEVEQFDLIITDMNMPNMNGLDLIKALRTHPNTQHKPILVLTTESDASHKAAGRAAGATGWIVKPFNPQALIDVLPRVLG